MAEKCSICGTKLYGVEHANGSLGAFSFSEACDGCQGAIWNAYRVAESQKRTALVASLLSNGGTPTHVAPTAPTGGN